MDAKTIIDSVASGKALEVKESLNSLLSARAFDALDAKKIELAQALFSTKDQIQNENIHVLSRLLRAAGPTSPEERDRQARADYAKKEAEEAKKKAEEAKKKSGGSSTQQNSAAKRTALHFREEKS